MAQLLLLCPSRGAWRAWLEERHASESEVWLAYFRKDTGKPSVTYPESVEEAICFGWIDGLKRRVDGERYCHRFTPRKPRSRWSPRNIEIALQMLAERRMAPAGLAAFERREEYAPSHRSLKDVPADLDPLAALLAEVRACRICEPHLPLGPRPVLQMSAAPRILIAGQAPGRKVHATGLPFDDPSGDRLRHWLGVTRAEFYDRESFAIVPMGFCYPGTGSGGDLPPRPECAATWRARLLGRLSRLDMTLVLGRYAQTYHFPDHAGPLADLVRAWRDTWPRLVPLPHPSPRNNRWLRNNPWFEAEVLPAVRARVAQLLARG